MKKELVSVIIPTYNRETVIGRAIESVLKQTYPHFELLIIDDGSTDQTKQVVEQIADERIRYILLEENGGVAHARNVGIAETQYDYIAFLDSDDEWMPEKLEMQMEKLLDSSAGFGAVYCRMGGNDWMGKPYIFPPYELERSILEGKMLPIMLMQNLIGTPTVLVRRECIEKVGGFKESLVSLEDWEWILRIAKEYRIGFVDKVLLEVHKMEGSVSTHAGGHIVTRCYLVSKYREDMRKANMLCDIEKAILNQAKGVDLYEETRELLSRDFEL